MKWFPIDPAYRVDATFLPYAKPKAFQVPNLLGDIDRMTAPGEVRFTLAGKEHRMTAFQDEGELWFVFRDVTSGETTYPAARFPTRRCRRTERSCSTSTVRRTRHARSIRMRPVHYRPRRIGSPYTWMPGSDMRNADAHRR